MTDTYVPCPRSVSIAFALLPSESTVCANAWWQMLGQFFAVPRCSLEGVVCPLDQSLRCKRSSIGDELLSAIGSPPPGSPVTPFEGCSRIATPTSRGTTLAIRGLDPNRLRGDTPRCTATPSNYSSRRFSLRGLGVRPISLLRSSLLRFVDSQFPGKSLWAWEFHPINI